MLGFSALELARIQFGFTISFHIIFPAITIGLASYLAVLEGLWHAVVGGCWADWLARNARALRRNFLLFHVRKTMFRNGCSIGRRNPSNCVGRFPNLQSRGSKQLQSRCVCLR
jgi:hypothetical protein